MGTFAARSARLSARIGRWPRRIAALCCLLLAAASALAPPGPRPTSAPAAGRTALHAGQVAVPLAVTSPSAALVRPGDRVGVVAGADSGRATLLADGLRVLSVHAEDGSLSGDADAGGAVVVVAASRSEAVAVAVAAANTASERLVLIVDHVS